VERDVASDGNRIGSVEDEAEVDAVDALAVALAEFVLVTSSFSIEVSFSIVSTAAENIVLVS